MIQCMFLKKYIHNIFVGTFIFFSVLFCIGNVEYIELFSGFVFGSVTVFDSLRLLSWELSH